MDGRKIAQYIPYMFVFMIQITSQKFMLHICIICPCLLIGLLTGLLFKGLPKGMDFTQVMNTFLNIEGVVRVHNLRIWALSMDKTAISAHLAICKCVSLSFRQIFNYSMCELFGSCHLRILTKNELKYCKLNP